MMEELLRLRHLAQQLRAVGALAQYPELAESLQQAEAAAYGFDGEPDLYGEMLRRYLFVGPDLGCYANFELRPEFVPLDKASALGQQVLTIFFGPRYAEYYAEEVARTNVYVSDRQLVAWWWDGDGTLLVGELRAGQLMRAAVNDDCKKTYGWSWVAPD